MTREERHIAVLNRMLENMDVYDSIQPTTERKKAIKAAIKALEQTTWIPVSERLPEENADILVAFVDREETRIIPVNYGRGTWFDCIFNATLDPLKITAWMPLPKPYEPQESEEKE